uniref:Uncharacterized protein n=1 Tax=Triticum urartu TaxID=4572 RepID=A0A8R7R9F0_TRIUA
VPVEPGHANHGGRHGGVVVIVSRPRDHLSRGSRAAEGHAGEPHGHEQRRAELHGHGDDFVQPADAPPHDHPQHHMDRAVHGRHRSAGQSAGVKCEIDPRRCRRPSFSLA